MYNYSYTQLQITHSLLQKHACPSFAISQKAIDGNKGNEDFAHPLPIITVRIWLNLVPYLKLVGCNRSILTQCIKPFASSKVNITSKGMPYLGIALGSTKCIRDHIIM